MTEGEDETESPARALEFEERKVDSSIQTETRGWAQSDKVTAHFGTQTYPSVVDSCTQTTPPVMPPPPQTSDAQVQTLSSNVLVHDRPDQCVFTELNQSYLCHHRTYADTAARALDDVRNYTHTTSNNPVDFKFPCAILVIVMYMCNYNQGCLLYYIMLMINNI